MKLNSTYKLSLPALRYMEPKMAQDAHAHAIMKVQRGVTELLLKLLKEINGTKSTQGGADIEYQTTVHVYSDERMHEVLREIETLITELRQRDLNGSADALRKVGYMLTSNKF